MRDRTADDVERIAAAGLAAAGRGDRSCRYVIVTVCVTPAVNAVVVIGAPVSVPVEVSTAVLTYDVTVLLFASCAVTRMSNAVPAVCCRMLATTGTLQLRRRQDAGYDGEGVARPVAAGLVVVADREATGVRDGHRLRRQHTRGERRGGDRSAGRVAGRGETAVLVKVAMLLFAAERRQPPMLNGVPAVCCAMLPPPAADGEVRPRRR